MSGFPSFSPSATVPATFEISKQCDLRGKSPSPSQLQAVLGDNISHWTENMIVFDKWTMDDGEQ